MNPACFVNRVVPFRALARGRVRYFTTTTERTALPVCLRRGFFSDNELRTPKPRPRSLPGTRLVHTTNARSDTHRETKVAQSRKSEVRAIGRFKELVQDALKVLDSQSAPKEMEILESLSTCEELGKLLRSNASELNANEEDAPTPATSLLFLDEGTDASSDSKHQSPVIAEALRKEAAERLSSTAQQLVTNPKVFITPKILQSYVKIQAMLEKPSSLAKVFTLYANKPIPAPDTIPIQYSPANPNKVSSAIPLETANLALSAAINAQDLPLCLDIIQTTVCTSAFRKHKIVQRALLPISAFALAPIAAYTLATRLSLFQHTMSDEMATNVAFAGILTYVGCTATIGIVALTTSNDQMERVTWATGTPLRERWVREEERSMIDKVACAWGFKETWKRGEEVGRDWEALRELVGLRGMVLDRAELMEGME